MNRPKSGLVRGAFALLLLGRIAVSAQEAALEEIRVEGSFEEGLELPRDRAVEFLIKHLNLVEETARARELQKANESVVTKFFDLTRYSPISFGASDSRLDTFFLQNSMRADLNPGRKVGDVPFSNR